MADLDSDLTHTVRSIPDYPKPGIIFRDITTLLGNARAFRRAVDELVQPWAGMKIDKVAGIEARGFILGGAVAHQVSAGFVPIRKKGKLPHKRVSVAYALEYGEDVIEMHADALVAGERVVLVDDLIATGGTAEAAVKLLRQLGANVLAACFVIDLPDLGGAEQPAQARRAGAHADFVRADIRSGSAPKARSAGPAPGPRALAAAPAVAARRPRDRRKRLRPVDRPVAAALAVRSPADPDRGRRQI